MITFDTDQYVYPAAKKIDITGINISRNEMRVSFRWLTAANDLVKSETLAIGGADFTEIMQSQISADTVGASLGVLLRRRIYKKIQDMLNIAGNIT